MCCVHIRKDNDFLDRDQLFVYILPIFREIDSIHISRVFWPGLLKYFHVYKNWILLEFEKSFGIYQHNPSHISSNDLQWFENSQKKPKSWHSTTIILFYVRQNDFMTRHFCLVSVCVIYKRKIYMKKIFFFEVLEK